MLPSAFIDGGKEADGFVVAGEIVEKVGAGADNRDDYSADNPHGYIITLLDKVYRCLVKVYRLVDMYTL